MKESDYIEASNLAKVRIALEVFGSVIQGYGPITQERKTEIYAPLARLLDECFAAINTNEEAK